jgi:hypothetical protein
MPSPTTALPLRQPLREFKPPMKCCGSPTTSIAAVPPSAAHVAQSTLQAVLFSEILKPLAKGLGPVGEIAVDSVAQHLFVPSRP